MSIKVHLIDNTSNSLIFEDALCWEFLGSGTLIIEGKDDNLIAEFPANNIYYVERIETENKSPSKLPGLSKVN